MKEIIRVTTCQTDYGNWRTYVTCYDDVGQGWELRAHGETRELAEGNGMKLYHEDCASWPNVDSMKLVAWIKK